MAMHDVDVLDAVSWTGQLELKALRLLSPIRRHLSRFPPASVNIVTHASFVPIIHPAQAA
jgi:hypothetical protein